MKEEAFLRAEEDRLKKAATEAERVRKLDVVAPDHLTAKAGLQKKYFNLLDLKFSTLKRNES